MEKKNEFLHQIYSAVPVCLIENINVRSALLRASLAIT